MRTRPSISWADLAGARVGVYGLGIEGTANLERLLALEADVVVVEDSPSAPESHGCEVLALAEGGYEALCSCEAVVKTPGVRRRRDEVVSLEARGIPVLGGLGLWFQGAPLSKVIAVTGTKGKSTTTAIAGHLLSRLGYKCLVAGNIGRPPWERGAPADFDYAVLEVSSYQATDVAVTPPVVAVTSLHPDHLDWHGGVEAYFEDKLSLCSQPGARVTVADGDNELLRARGGLLGPQVRWVGADDPLAGSWIEPLGLAGRHNIRNATIARICLLTAGVAEASEEEVLGEAAAGFSGLESRLKVIGEVGGVTFVDDSLSTNVLPAIAALEAYAGDRVALIVGGHDRGIDYAPLAGAIAARPPGSVGLFTLPESGPRIALEVLASLDALEISQFDDLDAAVSAAFAWAGGEGVVLLSPASPSFGQFRDYKDRAAIFARAVRRCGAS